MALPCLWPGVQNKVGLALENAASASAIGVLDEYTKTKTLTTLLGKSCSDYL